MQTCVFCWAVCCFECVYMRIWLVWLVSMFVCVRQERVLKSVLMVMRRRVCQQQMICVRVLAELSHGALLGFFDSSVFNGQPRTSFEYHHPRLSATFSVFWLRELVGFLSERI